MERVGQTLNRTGHHGSGNATDLTKQILADPRVASFIQEHSLSQDDMGVGKSFMLAAMAHELSETKKVATTIIHYPSFTIDVKNGIKDGSVKEQIDAVKQAEVLVLDDIGAEQFSSWIRDDVLQVILQHRMIEELPTFFTSNYSFADLEAKLSNGRQGDETWQAKRVMERIRFLAKEVHLKGVNRR